MADQDQEKSGFHLFNLFGFEVRLDLSWFFLALLVTWSLATGYFPLVAAGLGAGTYWVMGLFGVSGLFFSIILHELCHALVGRRYGLSIADIKLFIFGGVAQMHEEPPTPKAELLMAMAGPVFSLMLGFLISFLFYSGLLAGLPLPVKGVFHYLGVINIILGIFNLLPGYPLDGGRVLRAVLWWWSQDLRWATRAASTGGSILGFALVFMGVFFMIGGNILEGVWALILGLFLQHIAKLSYQQLLIRELFRDEPIRKYAKTDPVTVKPDITLQQFIDEYFYKYYHRLYPVTQNETLAGCVSIKALRGVAKEKWPAIRVREIMQDCSSNIFIDANTDTTKVLEKMNSEQMNRLIITDKGKLYGIITLHDLLNIIAFKSGS